MCMVFAFGLGFFAFGFFEFIPHESESCEEGDDRCIIVDETSATALKQLHYSKLNMRE